MNKELLLQTYIDHYKESDGLIRESLAGRNKSFVGLCIMEAVSFLIIYNPALVFCLLNETISKKLEMNVIIGNAIFQSFIWIVIAYILIRYIQFTMYIERQYKYINQLEKIIKDLMGDHSIFDREGENYLRDYPIILNLIDLFYKMFCPLFFIGINTVHINIEWRDAVVVGVTLIIDTIIYIIILIMTWFFFFELHDKISGWCKKHIIGVAWLSNKIHKLLKNV